MRTSTTLVAGSLLALAGCASIGDYEKAKSDTRRGGAHDQAVAAEAARQKQLRDEKVALGDKELLVKRELERMDQRITAAQDEGRRRDAEVQLALDQKRITREKYDDLKRQQASLQAELASLQIKNTNDQKKPQDPKVEAEKEKKLAALKEKQKTLEAELAKALAVKG